MAKIATYPDGAPLDGAEKLIGTDVNDANNTKNFTVQDIADFTTSGIPASTLQSVLNNGNTATQSINLTGAAAVTTVTSTTITNSGQVQTVAFYITGQFLDRNNLPGTSGQVLTSDAGGVSWADPVGDLGQVSVTVPSADFNLLNTVAYPVIPSPGAGKAIQVISASLKIDYNTTPYSFTATGVELEVSPGTPQVFITNSNVNVITNTFVSLTPVSSGAIAENSAVKLSAPSPQIGTLGDSDVTLDILYRIITV
jgi:hypothetical protein